MLVVQPAKVYSVTGTCIALRLEVVEGSKALDHRRQRRWNLRIAHVGDMRLAIDVKLHHLGAEGIRDLPSGAGEVDHHPVGINLVDAKPCDWSQLVTCWISSSATPNLSPNSSGVSHLWKLGEFRSLSSLISLSSACSCSRRALEEEEHVIDREGGRDRAAIVDGVRLRARVAGQRHIRAFVNLLRNPRPGGCVISSSCLSEGIETSSCDERKQEYAAQPKQGFSRHGVAPSAPLGRRGFGILSFLDQALLPKNSGSEYLQYQGSRATTSIGRRERSGAEPCRGI